MSFRGSYVLENRSSIVVEVWSLGCVNPRPRWTVGDGGRGPMIEDKGSESLVDVELDVEVEMRRGRVG